jgi:hypothetical protein
MLADTSSSSGIRYIRKSQVFLQQRPICSLLITASRPTQDTYVFACFGGLLATHKQNIMCLPVQDHAFLCRIRFLHLLFRAVLSIQCNGHGHAFLCRIRFLHLFFLAVFSIQCNGHGHAFLCRIRFLHLFFRLGQPCQVSCLSVLDNLALQHQGHPMAGILAF